jgi:ABC-2 type transport system permease protein
MNKKQELKKQIQKYSKNFFCKLKRIALFIYRSSRRIINQIGAMSLVYYRSPTTIFWTFIYPIILILLFGSMFSQSINPSYQLDVLDLDDSTESLEFCSYLNSQTILKINRLNDSSIKPEDWMKERNKIILLVIPPNWGANISNSQLTNLTVYHDPSSSSAETVIQVLRDAITELNFKLFNIEIAIGVNIENYFGTEMKFIDFFVPGVIMIAVTTSALITGLSYDLNEKNSGILYKYATTPMFRFEQIIAKQIWQFIIAVITSTLVVSFALIFDFSAKSLNPLMFVFVIFGSMIFSGIAMILVRIISNPEGVMAASIIFTIPQIFLSGALIPLDLAPNILNYFARITPLFYLTEGMRFLMLQYARSQFWLYFGLSFFMAIAFFVAGILIMSWRKD